MLARLFSMLTGAPEARNDQVKVIPAATVREWIEAGEAIVVDVREATEYRSERIPGAVLNPLSSFDPAAVPNDPAKKLVIHCRSGARCGMASTRLLQAGYTGTIHRLQGGIVGWLAAGGKVLRG